MVGGTDAFQPDGPRHGISPVRLDRTRHKHSCASISGFIHGPLLFFSNPASGQGRFNMTLKVSRDEGMTWPERWHTLYDAGARRRLLLPDRGG